MNINFDGYRAALETTYTDRVSAYRYEKVKDPVTKETKLAPVPFVENHPCRISQKALALNNQSDAQNDIQYETKLFISPDVEIKQGDMLEVT